MNSLLYSDYVVSQKYHNNGVLDSITTFIITIFSNKFISILFYFMNKLTNYPQVIGVIINEIKVSVNFLSVTLKLLHAIKNKILILLAFEIFFGLFMIYFLFIFL